jgi:HlyD family secretion protein
MWQKILFYKKWFALLIIIAIASVTGLHYFSKRNQPVFTGTTLAVERGTIKATVSATGTISAVNSVAVSSKITGLITKVNVNENDQVKAGQIMILLDDTALKAQVSQARAQLMNGAANYERSKKLAAIGGESMQQLDADRTTNDVDQATYDNAVSQLDDTIIRAPIDGMVIGKPIPAGQTVSPGISTPMVLLTVADLSTMQIQVLVDETDIGTVKVGQKVDFTVDAHPGKTFTGVVALISQSAVTQQNVIYYTVYVNIDSPEGLLFPTMTARVTINTGESNNALIVPLSAVKEVKGKKYVQVMVDGTPQNVQVELGLADDEKAEILSGLNEGDQLVLPATKSQPSRPDQIGSPPGIANPLRGLGR